MSCNIELHNGLLESGEMLCPFCNKQIQNYYSESDESCCLAKELIVVEGEIVCMHCGQVDGENFVNEWVDFHQNMYKIVRKSVYHRKYHIENMITDICTVDRIDITRDEINRICRVFDEIGKILPQVNDGRKRMINTKFILRQVFEMLGLPCKNIQISKSKRTLASNKQYWGKIQLLIGDKINSIIQS